MNTPFSRLILGIWRIGNWQKSAAEVADLVEACLDEGIDTFDLADIYHGYHCEALFGAALKSRPSLYARIRLISKCGIALKAEARPAHRVKHYNTSAAHIVASAERSLADLGAEQLECLLIHRPDPLLDADEVAEAFNRLQQSGKVASFGVSNFTPAQFDLLQSRLDQPLRTNQIEISLRQSAALTDGTLDHCQQHRIAPQAWSPLAGGGLAAASEVLTATLARLGEQLNATPEQLAIAWLLRHPARIHPVIGSGKIERIRQLVAAQSIALDRQHWFELWEAASGVPVP